MYLKLRILFTVLAAVCLAVVIPAGALFGWIWFGIFGGGAVMFFLAMLLCKQAQADKDPLQKNGGTDFISDDNDGTEDK